MYTAGAFANTLSMGNVYPINRWGSLPVATQATTPFSLNSFGPAPSATDSPIPGNNDVDEALRVGARGNPLSWWVGLAVLLIAFMYATERLNSEGTTYANIKLTASNIFVITLAAIVGMTLLKLAATKFKIPGLTTVILAA